MIRMSLGPMIQILIILLHLLIVSDASSFATVSWEETMSNNSDAHVDEDGIFSLQLLPGQQSATTMTRMAFTLWNGKLALYNGQEDMSFYDSRELCQAMNGHMPSIHSDADAAILRKLIGIRARAWLGGKETSFDDQRCKLCPGHCLPANYVCDGDSDCYDGSDEKNCHHGVDYKMNPFTWTDGTPVDYVKWSQKAKECDNSSCCALAFTTVSGYGNGFIIKECHNLRQMVCIVDTFDKGFTQQVSTLIEQDWNDTLKRHEEKIIILTRLNDQIKQFIDQQANQTLASLKSDQGSLLLGWALLRRHANTVRSLFTRKRTDLMERADLLTSRMRSAARKYERLMHQMDQLDNLNTTASQELASKASQMSAAKDRVTEKVAWILVLTCASAFIILCETLITVRAHSKAYHWRSNLHRN